MLFINLDFFDVGCLVLEISAVEISANIMGLNGALNVVLSAKKYI